MTIEDVEPLIDAERVREITKDCLTDEDAPEAERKLVEGIVHTYSFTPAKLEEHRIEIAAMLQGLPNEFKASALGGGGGWSFLNACNDANGVQWTGMHLVMESLLVLGVALDLVEWLMPREMWPALPGGVPYLVVKVGP